MVHNDNLNYFLPLTDDEIGFKDAYLRGEDPFEEDFRTIPSQKYLKPGQTLMFARHFRFAPTHEHTHDFIEVMYCLSGSVTHHIDGDTVTLNEGDIIILRQFTRHSIETALENDVCVNFILLPEFLDKTLEMLGEEPSPLHDFFTSLMKADRGEQDYLHISLGKYPHIQSLMDVMLWNLIHGVSNKNSINENLMGLVMLLVQDKADSNFGQSGDTTIWQVLHYIEHNYKTCSLKDCAETLHFDYYALANKVKRETGKTFIRLVQDKRLSQATYLLRGSSLTVHEIANAVGYENEGFFYRLFVDHYGMTPKEYRKKYK